MNRLSYLITLHINLILIIIGLTWSYMSSLTGKKIIADSGYGVAGGASNNNWPWYIQSNVDARIRDGVIAESLTNSQQNPNYSPKLC